MLQTVTSWHFNEKEREVFIEGKATFVTKFPPLSRVSDEDISCGKMNEESPLIKNFKMQRYMFLMGLGFFLLLDSIGIMIETSLASSSFFLTIFISGEIEGDQGCLFPGNSCRLYYRHEVNTSRRNPCDGSCRSTKFLAHKTRFSLKCLFLFKLSSFDQHAFCHILLPRYQWINQK